MWSMGSMYVAKVRRQMRHVKILGLSRHTLYYRPRDAPNARLVGEECEGGEGWEVAGAGGRCDPWGGTRTKECERCGYECDVGEELEVGMEW